MSVFRFFPITTARLFTSLALFTLITACGTNPAIETRNELSVREAFYDCRDEALQRDTGAREQRSPALYKTAARTMDRCLTEVDVYPKAVDITDRMQLHALSVAAYFKAGDIKASRAQLQSFELIYKGRDLYFADQSSFVDTFQLLLGEAPPSSAQSDSPLNAGKQVKSEIRRQQYWDTH